MVLALVVLQDCESDIAGSPGRVEQHRGLVRCRAIGGNGLLRTQDAQFLYELALSEPVDSQAHKVVHQIIADAVCKRE